MSRYGFPISDTRPFRTNRFTTILGAELHAPVNSQNEIWHILAVGLPEDFAPNGAAETGVELAQRAVEAGAFVAIAHPQWSSLTVEDGRALAIRACGRDLQPFLRARMRARRRGGAARHAAERRAGELTAVATDDAHFRVDDACGGWVMVKAEENEPAALLAALKAGHFYSSQGPLIHAAEVQGAS